MTKPLQNHAQKLSKFVKQNSVERSVGAENTLKKQWQRRDLNPRPKAYEYVISNVLLTISIKSRAGECGKNLT
jgi:hypothetical protein